MEAEQAATPPRPGFASTPSPWKVTPGRSSGTSSTGGPRRAELAELDLDRRVRLAAFEFLSEQTLLRGDVLSREVLARGFRFEGNRVPLLGPQGIFKPALLPEMPLSITTVPVVEGRQRPYDDELGADGAPDLSLSRH
jgi:hypothetical protein